MKFADLIAKLRGAQNSESAKIENAVVAEIIDQTLRKSEMDAIDYQYLRGILLGMTASITINRSRLPQSYPHFPRLTARMPIMANVPKRIKRVMLRVLVRVGNLSTILRTTKLTM